MAQYFRRSLGLLGFLIGAFTVASGYAFACSLAACVDHGQEFRSDIIVRFTNDDRPVSGISLDIKGNADGHELPGFHGQSDENGTVRIENLAPGDYWLNAEKLGIGAVSQCFHVEAHSTAKAKRKLAFEWGELAPAISEVSGKIIDLQNETGATPIWNLTHRHEVPIVGAHLTLREGLGNVVYTTTSDSSGIFAITGIPEGLYVLHIEGGAAGTRPYDGTDQIIQVTKSAKANRLLLTRQEASGGSCGGTSLSLTSE